jgi:hypothetical protein
MAEHGLDGLYISHCSREEKCKTYVTEMCAGNQSWHSPPVNAHACEGYVPTGVLCIPSHRLDGLYILHCSTEEESKIDVPEIWTVDRSWDSPPVSSHERKGHILITGHGRPWDHLHLLA